jgi:SnoaL-like domain
MSREAAVINAVNLFHLSVDRREWPTARSCLAGVVRLSEGAQSDAQELAADQFLGMIRSNVELFKATQHLVSGHHVHFDTDDAALCRANYQHHHVSDAGRWVVAGQQDVELRQGTGQWRITGVTLVPAWEEGRRPGR